ncbi:hypothetical protein RB201_33865 [Streptomyces sp. S1A(2023)]
MGFQHVLVAVDPQDALPQADSVEQLRSVVPELPPQPVGREVVAQDVLGEGPGQPVGHPGVVLGPGPLRRSEAGQVGQAPALVLHRLGEGRGPAPGAPEIAVGLGEREHPGVAAAPAASEGRPRRVGPGVGAAVVEAHAVAGPEQPQSGQQVHHAGAHHDDRGRFSSPDGAEAPGEHRADPLGQETAFGRGERPCVEVRRGLGRPGRRARGHA